MATMAMSMALMVLSKSLSTQEALSGIFGSISLATWIFLLVPQLILNYKTGSAEGISLAFLTVWLVGDITNLAGAIWADLVPTVIALAIYFCIADFVLISQCLYYNSLNARRAAARKPSVGADTEPLLSRQRSSDLGLPGSRRRSSAAAPNDTLHKIVEDEETSGSKTWVKNTASILLVCLAGAAGWVIAWKSGAWKPSPIEDVPQATQVAVGAEVLGYFSAVCYLGARIPQIVKNYREKSCEGLALLFFLLSLMGNATYGAGILFHSQEKEYLITNLPWLIGSLGTMVEDGIIFIQFRMYKDKDTAEAVEN